MGREKEKTIHLEEVIIMKNAKKLIPGAAIALVIAAAAKFLESLEESAGLHFIGASADGGQTRCLGCHNVHTDPVICA